MSEPAQEPEPESVNVTSTEPAQEPKDIFTVWKKNVDKFFSEIENLNKKKKGLEFTCSSASRCSNKAPVW